MFPTSCILIQGSQEVVKEKFLSKSGIFPNETLITKNTTVVIAEKWILTIATIRLLSRS